MSSHRKSYQPPAGKHDPCPPMKEKTYETPPNLYLGFQEPGMEQFKPQDALARGTLWPALFGPYEPPMPLKAPNKKGRE